MSRALRVGSRVAGVKVEAGLGKGDGDCEIAVRQASAGSSVGGLGLPANHFLTARWGKGAVPVLSPALGLHSLTPPIRGPTSKGKLLQCRCLVPAPGILVQQVWSRTQEVSFLTYVQQYTQKYRSNFSVFTTRKRGHTQ